jgi:hypothetical protein
MHIQVRPPSLEDRPAILNLSTFFSYDLLPYQPDDDPCSSLTPHGTLNDPAAATHEQSASPQSIWWTKPGILLPMLILADNHPAGFANVARPPHAQPSVDYRLEDLFIVNRYRRHGVGRAAVTHLLTHHPGTWEVGWLPKNHPAEQFWRAVTKPWHPQDWPVHGHPDTPPLPGLRLTVGPAA